MFADVFNSNGLECSVADVQSDFNKASPAHLRVVHDAPRKMQPGRWSGNGASPARENRLVTLAVCCARLCGTLDIRRKGCLPNFIQNHFERTIALKPQYAQRFGRLVNDFGPQLRFAELQTGALLETLCWPHKRLPEQRLNFAHQEHFHAAT